MSKNKAFVPDHISEEYYQISPEILASFNKFRPPVDLFRFKEDVARLLPLFRKGQRLTAEQAEEIQLLCQQEELFVARSDYPLYSKHICRQLDLVLADRNLKEGEIAEILYDGLTMRLDEFFPAAGPGSF